MDPAYCQCQVKKSLHKTLEVVDCSGCSALDIATATSAMQGRHVQVSPSEVLSSPIACHPAKLRKGSLAESMCPFRKNLRL